MYIHEAIKALTTEKPCITRSSWMEFFGEIKLFPTDTHGRVFIMGPQSRRSPFWEPALSDLVADDWIPCD